jgi:hypothetical protein
MIPWDAAQFCQQGQTGLLVQKLHKLGWKNRPVFHQVLYLADGLLVTAKVKRSLTGFQDFIRNEFNTFLARAKIVYSPCGYFREGVAIVESTPFFSVGPKLPRLRTQMVCTE